MLPPVIVMRGNTWTRSTLVGWKLSRTVIFQPCSELFRLNTTFRTCSIRIPGSQQNSRLFPGSRNSRFSRLGGHPASLFKKKPSYMGNQFIKKLPTHISNCINQFRRLLKGYLIEHFFYGVDDFLSL